LTKPNPTHWLKEKRILEGKVFDLKSALIGMAVASGLSIFILIVALILALHL